MGTAKRQRAIEKRKKSTLKKTLKTSQKITQSPANPFGVRIQTVGNKTSIDGNTISVEDMVNILVPETEPLTDELYQELSYKGFSKQDFDDLKSMGFRYDRARDTFSSL